MKTACIGLSVIALWLGLGPAAWSAALPTGSQGVQSWTVPLLRPAGAPDGNAFGSLRLRSKPNKNDERFELKVKQVDTDLDFELFVQDASDPLDPDTKTFSFVAKLETDKAGSEGSMKWKALTKKGDSLPLGAADVAQLFGREIEIRVEDDLYLRAILPGGKATKGKTLQAISMLVRPDNPPDADATGDVRLSSQASKGKERFEVNAYDVDVQTTHDLYLEDPPGSDKLVNIGSLDAMGQTQNGADQDDDDDDEDPQFELRLDTKQGDELPLDVSSNNDLLDRRVQIRSEGDVVLQATLPSSWGGPEKNLKAEVSLSTPNPAPLAGAGGKVKLRQQPHKNRDLFDVFIWDVDGDENYHLWVETGVDTDEFEEAGKLTKTDDGGSPPQQGNLIFVADTSDGTALPFDVASTEDLFGRRVEIVALGELVLQGAAPTGYSTPADNASAKLKLLPIKGAPTNSLKGTLRISSKPIKGDERFEVSVKKLDFSASTWHVAMETEPGKQDFQDIGELTQLGKSSKGRLRLRTKDGAALPFDVATIHELANLQLLVRDDTEVAYLMITIPDLLSPAP